jgi:hypothetical protein
MKRPAKAGTTNAPATGRRFKMRIADELRSDGKTMLA